jgi:hypothetical protein
MSYHNVFECYRGQWSAGAGKGERVAAAVRAGVERAEAHGRQEVEGDGRLAQTRQQRQVLALGVHQGPLAQRAAHAPLLQSVARRVCPVQPTQTHATKKFQKSALNLKYEQKKDESK